MQADLRLGSLYMHLQHTSSVIRPLEILLVSLTFMGCSSSSSVGQITIISEVDIEVLEGANASDTIEAHLPVRVVLTPVGNEDPQGPLRLSVTFTVLGEDCGSPLSAVAQSADNDEATGTWVLGVLAQSCTMEVRVFGINGALIGITSFEASVEPGQPVDGWLTEGTDVRAIESVTLGLSEHPLFDRLDNELLWRFLTVSGPAVVLGEALDDDRARTLVATGLGAGEVDIVTVWGPYTRASFDVCLAGEVRWIRLFRPENAAGVLGACP